MSNILISVIVPVYNVEGYLKKCIESICHQTYENLEIIFSELYIEYEKEKIDTKKSQSQKNKQKSKKQNSKFWE